jgi:hypothetical protein
VRVWEEGKSEAREMRRVVSCSSTDVSGLGEGARGALGVTLEVDFGG